jgi:hypothetical protein
MAACSDFGATATPVNKDKEICGDCNKVVHERDKGLFCEVCDFWYHAKCQNVSSETYVFLQKNTGLHWYCKSCDKGVSKLLHSMSLIQKRQDMLEGELTGMKADISEMRTSIKELDTKMECMIEAKLCESITEKVDEKVDVKVKVMSAKVEEEMEIERRKYNLIFHGVKESETMADSDIIKNIVANGLKLDPNRHIDDVMRIGKTVSGKIRPIRITARSFESRKEILLRAKDLKSDDMHKTVYITPDLTRKQQEIDKKLRDNLKRIREAGEPTAKIHSGKVIKNVEGNQVVVLYELPK